MIAPDSGENAGVLVFLNANLKADILALFGWLDAGLTLAEPERIGEGKFVVRLQPGVHHDVVDGATR